MNFELIEHALPMLLVGAGVTIEITAVSVAIGFLIGLFVGIARICQVKILRIIATVYADCIRGTPLLVQIFLIYFALPIVTGHRVEPFAAAVAACGINGPAPMYLKFSGPVSRPLTWDRWKQADPWASPGGRPCTMSSFHRQCATFFRLWAMSLLLC